MAEAQPPNSRVELGRSQPTFRPGPGRVVLGGTEAARRSTETVRLLTLSEAAEHFDVDHKMIYRLAELELIDPLQRDGRGRVYYSERQIARALADKRRYPVLTAA